MFSQRVNIACNNALFSPPTMAGMDKASTLPHPSMERLLRVAAARNDALPADVARSLNVSDQVVHNWARRGVSSAGARKAQHVYGCDANWILEGEAAAPMVRPALGEGGIIATTPISQSDATLTHPSPVQVQRVKVRGLAMVDGEGFWKELQEAEGDEYVAALGNDPDAYAIKIVGRRFYPVIDSGQCVVASPGAPLKMHKRVLVRLADGRHTVRLYLNHEAGLWMFAGLTDANDVLELRDDQVAAVERVVAVSDSE